MKFKILLFFCLGLFITACSFLQINGNISEKISVKKINYQGWQDSYILSNSEVEAIVVPQVSRVMQFRFKGGEGAFWENPELSGKTHNIKSKKSDYFNVGGDKTWPAPQSEWGKNTGRVWPPPTTFDSVPVRVEVNSTDLTLISPVDSFYGIRFYRKVSLEPQKSIMKITTTYEKVKGKSLDVSVWTVTQFPNPVGVFAALPQPSIFPQGYNKQSKDLPANLKVDNGILSLTRDRQKSHKIGSDASILLWVGEKFAVRMDSLRIAGAIYPDNDSSSEIYTNSDPDAFVELEFLSPLKKLKVGEKMDLTTTYTLIKRTTDDAQLQAKRIFGSIITSPL